MKATDFAEAYRGLLLELYHSDLDERNARTGHVIRTLRGGHSFRLDLEGHLPVAGNRRYWPHVAAAETAWQFMGTQDATFIVMTAPKIWEKFVEDGRLETAYGYRWREHFGRDQLELAMEELQNNPTNRQVYVSAWDPASDGLGGPQPKNIPCPVGFSLTRTEDEVHCSVFIRSSDVFVGLPYDVMCYALTLDAVASSIGCRPGTLHVTLAHPHLYHVHLPHVEDCIVGPQFDRHDSWKDEYRGREDRQDWTDCCEPPLPAWPVDMIVSQPYDYVEHVRRLSGRVANSGWNPLPELVV